MKEVTMEAYKKELKKMQAKYEKVCFEFMNKMIEMRSDLIENGYPDPFVQSYDDMPEDYEWAKWAADEMQRRIKNRIFNKKEI